MDISGILISYLLGDHTFVDCHFDTKRTYRGFSIPASDPENMAKDIVYICLMSDALNLQRISDSFSYLCIQDRVLLENETDSFHSMILIQENIALGDLYSNLINEYGKLEEWNKQSLNTLLGGCSYQRILDLAEDIIHEPIYVMDSTFKLLANTKNYSSPDPMNISLEEFGYHTDETIEILNKNHRLELYSRETGFIINEPGFSQFPTITKCFNTSGKTELIVTLVCVNKGYSDVLLELFRILTKYIRIGFKNARRGMDSRISPQDLMLYKLIYEEESTPFTVAERARSSIFPITGRFVLFRIMYDTEPNVLVDKALDMFRSVLPGEHVFSHNYEITIISILKESSEVSRIQELICAISPCLEKYHMICGVSSVFSNLHEIKRASDNATTALSFGRKLLVRGRFFSMPDEIWKQFTKTEANNFYSFDSLFEFICISVYLSTHKTINTESVRLLTVLQDHDQKHRSSYLLILLCYLMYGNRATDVGNALHMHRNNVVYSIDRIQELLSIDLNSIIVCDNLKTAYRIMTVAQADSNETRM